MVAEQLVGQMDELKNQLNNQQAALVNLAAETEGLENATTGKNLYVLDIPATRCDTSKGCGGRYALCCA